MINFAFAGKDYQTDRVIGKLESDQGPIVVFVGGMHGNEPSGVVALQEVFGKLTEQMTLTGSAIAIAGNMTALQRNCRFISCDLNRIWEGDKEVTDSESATEHAELLALKEIFTGLFRTKRPLIFVDLHTTSSDTMPFVVVSNREDNVCFTSKFSLPKVIGLEAFLHGPMLNWIDSLGHRTMAFEAGRHDDPDSVKIHQAFIWIVLLHAGIIGQDSIPDLSAQVELLESCALGGNFEVVYRKEIGLSDQFKMKHGYQNFTPIRKGELLATDCRGDIVSDFDGRIFMPLYQNSGEDGFFVVQEMHAT